ncbi:arsenate reductase family protein [Polaribacter sp. HL-MS24]|uniref:arsenate reductase family protein n=1 Tax=Polaribacter sp. HL-MS24 TaxID=3077735 RepID=UPI002934C627|nr:ArsC/Spx/MgsR family protein [Polaribacter sp. HL-MS24]WOC39501.1 ArsC/Spx/MgsR family protein [Polaribacter sp. HL-MS24]
MRKVYFLQTCDTCRRILKEVNTANFEQQEIKTTPVTLSQLETMHHLSGSYEALFNKRAKLYASMDLKNKSLSEADFKKHLLEEYTFLKRPVFIVDNEIFIGNSKKVITELKSKIN